MPLSPGMAVWTKAVVMCLGLLLSLLKTCCIWALPQFLFCPLFRHFESGIYRPPEALGNARHRGSCGIQAGWIWRCLLLSLVHGDLPCYDTKLESALCSSLSAVPSSIHPSLRPLDFLSEDFILLCVFLQQALVKLLTEKLLKTFPRVGGCWASSSGRAWGGFVSPGWPDSCFMFEIDLQPVG